MAWTKTLTAAAAASLFVAGGAVAQGLDAHSKDPIDVTSQDSSFQANSCETTFSGAAEAMQGTSRLRAHVIKAFLKKKPPGAAKPAPNSANPADQTDCGGGTDRIEADGDVFYVTPDQVAHGDHAVYTADDDLIVMTGGVVVVQGKDVIRGDRMVIHIATRDVEITSGPTGRGTPGRVRGVFYPNQPGSPGLPNLGGH